MASNRLAHKLLGKVYLAKCMPVIKRHAAAAAMKGTDAAMGGKAAECTLHGGSQKARTMASAAQELHPEGKWRELRHARGGRRETLSHISDRDSPLGVFDWFDSFFPDRNLRSMIETMDRMFYDPFVARDALFARDPFSPLSRVGRVGFGRGQSAANRPPWDFAETEDAFRMRLDLPGLSKEEVEVFVEDDYLVIKGEHNEPEINGVEAHSGSRSHTSRIILPDNADAKTIKAELKNGVLSVTVPKLLEAEVKKRSIIEVE